MNNDNVVPVRDAPLPRRDFLRKSILLALPAAFGGLATPAFAATMSAPLPASKAADAYFNPPTRARGAAVHNVRDHGALGNGSADDTAAFQNAIDSLPSDGGTVYVPAGNYKIDALRSVRLRSRMHLEMHPDAVLMAKPNAANVYAVLLAKRLDDVEISGGQIVGERDSHQGTTGEGGHCVTIQGCNRVTVRDIRLTKGWGDGMSIGPSPVFKASLIMSRDVAVVGVVCTSNRRNALSITNAIDVKVYDSEFSGTNGTKPQCGIDIEPNPDDFGSNNYCDKIHIENCVISENAKNGILIWRRARGITIKHCVIHKNGGSGIFTEAATGVVLTGNTISNSSANGVFIRLDCANWQVDSNTFHSNYTRLGIKTREPFDLTGAPPKVERDIMVAWSVTTNIQVGLNHYR